MSAPSVSRIPSLNSTLNKRLSVNNMAQMATNDENAAPATTRKSLANNAANQPPKSILKRVPSNDSTTKSAASTPRAALAAINSNTNSVVPPTPTAAKSYSELKKSEQLLQERVAEMEKKMALIQVNEQDVHTEQQSRIAALQQQHDNEVQALKQSNAEQQSAIEKSEQLIASLREQLELQLAAHEQQIADLTSTHTASVIATESKLLEAQNRVNILEAKLEHCGINVITMTPFVLSEDAKEKEMKLSAELETKIATLTARVAEMKTATMSRLASVGKWKQEEEIATRKN